MHGINLTTIDTMTVTIKDCHFEAAVPVVTCPLDPSLDWPERGALRGRLADDWRAENGSDADVGVDLLPSTDGRIVSPEYDHETIFATRLAIDP